MPVYLSIIYLAIILQPSYRIGGLGKIRIFQVRLSYQHSTSCL